MKLNLGCGYRKLPDCVNIDNRAEVEPDLVLDVIQGLPYTDDRGHVIHTHARLYAVK